MGARDQRLITRGLESTRDLSLKDIGETVFVLALVTSCGRGSAKCLRKASSVGNE